MNTEILTKAITGIAFGITGAIFITPIFIFLRNYFTDLLSIKDWLKKQN